MYMYIIIIYCKETGNHFLNPSFWLLPPYLPVCHFVQSVFWWRTPWISSQTQFCALQQRWHWYEMGTNYPRTDKETGIFRQGICQQSPCSKSPLPLSPIGPYYTLILIIASTRYQDIITSIASVSIIIIIIIIIDYSCILQDYQLQFQCTERYYSETDKQTVLRLTLSQAAYFQC